MAEGNQSSGEFGLSIQDIPNAVEETKMVITKRETDLANPELGQIFPHIESFLDNDTAALKALTADSPDVILYKIHKIYSITTELEAQGVAQVEIGRRVLETYPDSPNYYPVLKQTGWGERISQYISFYISHRDHIKTDHNT